MGYFSQIQANDHEQVVFCSDKETGLRAIIAIHNTALGPALGGCRMRPYASEEEALADVLKLSRAMTYKSSTAGLNLGGGKTVVMLDSPEQKTPALLRALARRIDALRGTYIGAGDIGSNTQDLAIMKRETRWVTGLAKEDGGLGDSAILTSLGVFKGIQASVKHQFGREDMTGLKVLVQGAGKVGYQLVGHLTQAGCEVLLTDINESAMNQAKSDFPNIQLVSNDDLWTTPVDIFSPNAIGGILTAEVAEHLPVSIVAGGANNILADDTAGEVLKSRGVLYAPDFVINAGGVIMVACEIEQLGFDVARQKTEALYNRTLEVFQVAEGENVTTHEAAMRLAMRRIDATRKKPQRGPVPEPEARPAVLC